MTPKKIVIHGLKRFGITCRIEELIWKDNFHPDLEDCEITFWIFWNNQKCGPFTIRVETIFKAKKSEFDLVIRKISLPLNGSIKEVASDKIGLYPRKTISNQKRGQKNKSRVFWGNPQETRFVRNLES